MPDPYLPHEWDTATAQTGLSRHAARAQAELGFDDWPDGPTIEEVELSEADKAWWAKLCKPVTITRRD